MSDLFALPISTLHYWERRGLLAPERRGRWRFYGNGQLHRIALIQLWRDTGLMSLDDIVTILSTDTTKPTWHSIVTARIDAIDAQIERLTAARDYLRHFLGCPHGDTPEDCPSFRAAVAPRIAHLDRGDPASRPRSR